jgi:octaprenyl-diphosphate synthase
MNTGRTSASEQDIKAPVRRELQLLEQELERIFTTDIALISTISEYLITTKGKRVRPLLVMLCAKLGAPETSVAVRVAAAVEIIHTATLLHDDSIDRSDLRRGLPTVNRLWNDQVSVIMGDYLFCTAFRLLHEARLFDVASVISRGSDRLTFGEMFQMDLRGQYDVSEETYLRMTKHKTAALFTSACEAGGMVGGVGPDGRSRLAEYGECIGIAFQMIDDVLDFIGDVDLIGKPVGNDLRDGRITLPMIAALRNADRAEAGRIRAIVASGELSDSDWQDVLCFVDVNGGIAYARGRASELAERAKACVANIKSCPAKKSLVLLADRLVSRRK